MRIHDIIVYSFDGVYLRVFVYVKAILISFFFELWKEF